MISLFAKLAFAEVEPGCEALLTRLKQPRQLHAVAKTANVIHDIPNH